MLPNPLHPAVVHFPVVIAVLLPFFAVWALWLIRRGATPRRTWGVPLALAAVLWLSAWAAVETGENQDERVESVVAEKPLSTHEDMAEMFLTASIVVMLVAAAGMAPGKAGTLARGLATAGSVVLVVGAARVGHSGGQLVYRYGAASAYANPSADSTMADRVAADRRRGDDDDR